MEFLSQDDAERLIRISEVCLRFSSSWCYSCCFSQRQGLYVHERRASATYSKSRYIDDRVSDWSCPQVCLYVCMSVHVSVHVSVHLLVHVSVCLFVHVFVHPSVNSWSMSVHCCAAIVLPRLFVLIQCQRMNFRWRDACFSCRAPKPGELLH